MATVMQVVDAKVKEDGELLSETMSYAQCQAALRTGRSALPNSGRTKHGRDASVRTLSDRLRKINIAKC